MKKKLLFLTFSSILYSSFAFTQSARLITEELKVLNEIGEKLWLSERNWRNFGKDPCRDEGDWHDFVKCDCSFDSNTTCRVTEISMTSQNVSTVLPSKFAELQYLQILDLSCNYFRASIPSEWATMRLSELSLMENTLFGPFPTILTKITTLRYLSIQGNRFSGPIPKEIANLKSLEKLVLSSNEFTGQLPVALAKLTNLTDLRISDNNFTGKIPNFISQWTQISNLQFQGCSFEGPIPSSISVLTKLEDLRISDLKSGASTFPPLRKMTKLSILVLRNCLIRGPIPRYVGNLRNLQTLDLSFNNLTGEIPSSFSLLRNVDHIYLTKNDLTGPMPQWIFSSIKNVDVSYNHFTWDASGPKICEQGTINVVESYSSSINIQDDIHPCLRKDFPCTKSDTQKIFSLHINCGGAEVNINNTIIYEADTERRGASSYYNAGNWAFSSTGNFLDEDHDFDDYMLSNTSNLYNTHDSDAYTLSNTSELYNTPKCDMELYTTARKAAISLTYYGLCLLNGKYTVKLHFAEIGLTDDNLFNSIGKRVFNVYVQGELKLIDFDIVKEARGVGIGVIKSYTVIVKNNTLKIQLYWAGKGTTGIPMRGSYGPIISAISVDPHFVITRHHRKRLDVGLIVGIVGGVTLVLIIMICLWRKGYNMNRNQPIEVDQMSHTTSFN
uniref:non-specific serine/threonine protein kinase n=1 Tax=Helianthus annuus TaxID=4232 RepID=A0A251RTL4_HELAN